MPRTPISLPILGALLAVSVCATPAAGQTAATLPAPPQAKPVGAEPDMMPPTPPMASPPAPGAQPIETPPPMTMAPAPAAAPAPVLRTPPGQWVYTQQYGWLYLPYGQAFTHVVDDAALAYAYAYYPAFGWRWVVAPWVLGFGVTPYWGAFGPVRFAWYAHPWFRIGTAHLRPTWGRGMGPHPAMRAMGRFGGGHGRR